MPSSQRLMRRVWSIVVAHVAVDFYMTLYPPLLAIFKTHFSLSLFQVSLLPMVVSVFGAIPQPFMGHLGDRTNRVVVAAVGVFICGLFMSSIGLAPSAGVLALFLFLAALGSSLFHPNGGGLATASAPDRSNFAVALFLTGGTLGMAAAPITGTQIVERLGLSYLWILVFPSIILSCVLMCYRGLGQRDRQARSDVHITFALLRTAALRPLWFLYAIAVLRSVVHVSYIAFMSILGQGRGWTTGKIGWAFSAYLVASTLGRIVGGYAGDHVSPRKILALSSALAGVLYLGFCSTIGTPSLVLLFLAGFCFELGSATNVVLAQRVLPGSTSAATGMVMGFAWGTAGLLIPLMGKLAEATSLPFTLALVATILFPAAALVALLAAARPGSPEADIPTCGS